MGGDGRAQHPLTYVRQNRGMSMDELALRLALAACRRGLIYRPGRDRIYKWESSRVDAPSGDYQMLLADVFGVDHDDVVRHGWPWWLPAYETPHPFTADGSRAALLEVLVALEHPDRRAFLAFTTGALVTTACDWATIEPERLTGALHGRRVDATLLAWLETRTDELRALTNTAAPECTDLIDALLKTTIRLINTGVYDAPSGRRLHQVAASAAQCAGWLHFDQGEHTHAVRHWIGALHAAHAADNRDLGAGILSDMAYAANWLNQPSTAVDILEHARTRTHSAAARSLLDLRRARALAALGDDHNTGRALHSAEHELDRARPGHAPAWVSWMSPADLAIDAGRCWLDLGKHQRAETALTEGLQLLDPARGRTRSVMLAYRAEGALARHDLPTATSIAREALTTARATQAARCIQLADTTLERFAPHRAHPAVADLYAYAAG
ncbi:XRE family transcriptional regulator [Streptomyces sp. NPDC050485]|uniref:XRE family transcriptional regulator n=1 Tax=Streptomyces sp. NPDC050485 TaxID=3365617 RepID=UPI0037977C7B